ncbi:hypothetical protein GCM10023084_35560 [Streptomyces lacrimifluminis]|uniref:Uncharacterized protein n=1 Tax=Streptomyces lacrimifluminis TaxID=1500077 RepID=A0A917L3F7_9ACTN|nr:hypothetical protein GCM10012282_38390 [Streptomyces lacrimifluminis]
MDTVWVRGSRTQGETGEIILRTPMVTAFFPAGNREDGDFLPDSGRLTPVPPVDHFRPSVAARPCGFNAGPGG